MSPKGEPPASRSSVTRYRLGGLLLVLAVAYFIGEAVAIAGWEGRPYRITQDAISTLGVPEEQYWGGEYAHSSRHAVMNATFIATGVRAALAVLVLAPFAPRKGRVAVLVLALLYAAGLVMVGLYPAGLSAVRSNMHGLGAALTIGGGCLLLLALSIHLSARHRRLGIFTAVCAAVGVFGWALIGLDFWGFGLTERITVYAVVLWQVGAGLAVLASRPPGPGPSRPSPVLGERDRLGRDPLLGGGGAHRVDEEGE